MVVKATEPAQALGLLYLLKNCHARGADPFAVSLLCDHCVPVCFDANCGCVPLDLGSALHCVVSIRLSAMGLIEVDHGPLVFGRMFPRL